jgi:putative two-component system response regulator
VLASWLAKQQRRGYQIDEAFVNLIYKTSPLHDIGKIAIPDCVLLKPGRLDEGEFEIMKMHTLLGARMLSAAMREFPNAEFLQMAQNVALSHHERYDGGGYPQGLTGDDIPLAGRIVALADVYDALTSKRVYKSAFSHDFAKTLITEKSKGQFDPTVVEAFLANEHEFRSIRAEFADENENDPPEYAAAVFSLPDEREI